MSLQVEIEKKLRDMTLSISFDAENSGEITGILGASGCGKSMALKCIAGIERPDRGRIVLNGRVLFDSEKNIDMRVQERKVGYLFQNYALFPNMTVRQNVEIALRGGGRERRRALDGWLRLLCLEDFADSYPARLSGGQQQRAALARILASAPDVLMLDEPFSALDAFLKENLQLEILNVLRKYRGDILLVTHSRDEAYRFCSRIHVLEGGRLVRSGNTREVFEEPRAIAAARLTGCKNIEEAVRLSESAIAVPKWGATLHFRKKSVPSDTTAIGIRAHYLREAAQGEKVNVLDCRCREILEDPFEVTLILENGLWWKIPKETWRSRFHETIPEKLALPEESVLFLRR